MITYVRLYLKIDPHIWDALVDAQKVIDIVKSSISE